MRILIVEDDLQIAKWMVRMLGEAGYRIDSADNGDDGLRLGASGDYDLALIDLELPMRSGIAVVEGIRAAGRTLPLIIMTGRGHDDDVVRGLDAGADDYLVKPVANAVLRARIRAALRRGGAQRSEQVAVGTLTLDRISRRVESDGTKLDFTPREYSLLEHFMLRPGEVITRADLLERVWGMQFDPGSNVINATMNRLRAKLRAAIGAPDLRTVRGVGFVLSTEGRAS